jgi:hypothetical protein
MGRGMFDIKSYMGWMQHRNANAVHPTDLYEQNWRRPLIEKFDVVTKIHKPYTVVSNFSTSMSIGSTWHDNWPEFAKGWDRAYV